MKFLLDTNLLIRIEPTSQESLEPEASTAIELVRLIADSGHQIYIHPATLTDISRDSRTERRRLRELLVEKYPAVPAPPRVPAAIETELGRPEPDSNDDIDHRLLAAAMADAVDYLVTDDHRLVRKARRVGLADRVVLPPDAIAILRGLADRLIEPPPAVERLYAHELDESDPIFETFRDDYHDFDTWFQKCKRSHRLCWAIRKNERLAAVAIVKEEHDREHGLTGRLLKICSFKVAGDARGYRFGELLLKPIFDYAFSNGFDHAYTEVLPRHDELIDLMQTFGFRALPSLTEKGELVLEKALIFGDRDVDELSALDFHIRFGPRFLRARDVFLIPIEPRFHDMLFPECAEQPTIFSGASVYGNSILKAYLCHSPSRQLTPGSVVLFYESGGKAEIRCVGVVEDTLASSDPARIARFVGKRTVYSLAEIEAMCRQREVLAILFRQAAGLIGASISLDQLVANDVSTSWPQSITRARVEGLAWIREQIEQSP